MTKNTREKLTDARRTLILQTAALCFARDGFHQTSIRDIANQAGISVGNVYNHFDSKAELIAEIALLEAAELDPIIARLDQANDPRKALDQFVDIYLAYCGGLDDARLAAEIVAEGLRNRDVAKGYVANRARLDKALTSVLEAMPGAEKNRAEVAKFIPELIEGLAFRTALKGRQPKKKEIASLKAAVMKLAET